MLLWVVMVRIISFFWIGLFVVIGSVFWARGVIFLDPDFGWHLKTGELILREGIPKSDPFSYTMPSYPFVDQTWLIDVVMARLYPAIGAIGLAGFYAVFLTLTLAIGVFGSVSRLKRITVERSLGLAALLLLAAATLLYYSRVHSQAMTWFFFSVLLWTIHSPERRKRYRYFIPFLFMFWANIHGGFMAGLATLAFFIIVRSIRRRRFLGDFLVLCLSSLATLVNPYGFQLWVDVGRTLLSSTLMRSIQEWLPAIQFINVGLPFLLAFSGVLIWRYKASFSPEALGLYGVFVLAGLWSQRHIPLWVVVGGPLGAVAVERLALEAVGMRGGRRRLVRFWLGVLLISLAIFVVQVRIVLQNVQRVSEEQFYPRWAVEYLRSTLPSGQVFSSYEWGGYFLWKLPEKRVFVDGRMPIWRWVPPPRDSGSAFEEYLRLVRGELPIAEVFEKYGIDTVVWPVVRYKDKPSFTDRLEFFWDAVFGAREDLPDFGERLVAEGWGIVYRDPVAVIYRKM